MSTYDTDFIVSLIMICIGAMVFALWVDSLCVYAALWIRINSTRFIRKHEIVNRLERIDLELEDVDGGDMRGEQLRKERLDLESKLKSLEEGKNE